ncbi:OB-fold domain-containing protein [Dactylosporangium sp. NPDC051485]|uniref:OB-fold domain-containing protein n=1 Tax=Dactylosporangium sp. NPDC051485 TaxID=3154846 RepID=UPI00341A1E60
MYLPRYRLSRGEIASAIGARANGTRVVAGHDQDATSLAVEAASRLDLATAAPRSLWYSTTSPAYLEKTNATAIHAAVGLDEEIPAFDLGANARSAPAALLSASASQGIAVMADLRQGDAGGSDERDGGDAAAAFAFGPQPVAELLATASTSAEFLDRWRLPTEVAAHVWEERFGQREYDSAGLRAVALALSRAGLTHQDVTLVGVAGPNARATKSVTAACTKGGARAVGADLLSLVGNCGSTQFGLVLADLLDQARPGDVLLCVSLADGADAFVLRATERIGAQRSDIRGQLEPSIPVDYPKYLVWRGRVAREAPRRPDPQRPSAPFARRNEPFKFGFRGGRCLSCGRVQFPLPRVCYHCHAVDRFEVVRGAGQRATIVTFTVDRLAFSPSPPLRSAVVELEQGGRIQCELTDVAQEPQVGDTVEMTFRRAVSVETIHNYLWKARPVS